MASKKSKNKTLVRTFRSKSGDTIHFRSNSEQKECKKYDRNTHQKELFTLIKK